MTHRLQTDEAINEFVGELLGGFASIALLLSVIGVYGLLQFLVQRRFNEFGIRMSIGAQPASIARLILSQAVPRVGARHLVRGRRWSRAFTARRELVVRGQRVRVDRVRDGEFVLVCGRAPGGRGSGDKGRANRPDRRASLGVARGWSEVDEVCVLHDERASERLCAGKEDVTPFIEDHKQSGAAAVQPRKADVG